MCSCTNCAAPTLHNHQPNTFWIAIYPQNMRTKIALVEMKNDQWDEINDYHLASDRRLASEDEAIAYAKALANIQGATFVGEDNGAIDR